jgi:RNA polymerase sigma-B factor
MVIEVPAREERTAADRKLLQGLRDGKGLHGRDEIIEHFMPLARSCAARYRRRNEPFDDLEQVAYMGLVKAVDRYDPSQGVAFSSYAVPTIMGELKRHFRDRTWAVRPPRDLQEEWLRVERAVKELTEQHGRKPTVEEIAQRMGSTEEDVLEALNVRNGLTATSLDAPRKGTGDDGGDAMVDLLGSTDNDFRLAEARATLSSLMSILTDRERLIVRLRFEQDLTQDQIGEMVGLSQMQISRILRSSIERLRAVAQHGETLALAA